MLTLLPIVLEAKRSLPQSHSPLTLIQIPIPLPLSIIKPHLQLHPLLKGTTCRQAVVLVSNALFGILMGCESFLYSSRLIAPPATPELLPAMNSPAPRSSLSGPVEAGEQESLHIIHRAR
jgi:hypothetical protein